MTWWLPTCNWEKLWLQVQLSLQLVRVLVISIETTLLFRIQCTKPPSCLVQDPQGEWVWQGDGFSVDVKVPELKKSNKTKSSNKVELEQNEISASTKKIYWYQPPVSQNRWSFRKPHRGGNALGVTPHGGRDVIYSNGLVVCLLIWKIFCGDCFFISVMFGPKKWNLSVFHVKKGHMFQIFNVFEHLHFFTFFLVAYLSLIVQVEHPREGKILRAAFRAPGAQLLVR